MSAKRSWFQFHLSTAVVMMFVASGLLWLNMYRSDTVGYLAFDISDVPDRKNWVSYHRIAQGWPAWFSERYTGGLSGSQWRVPGLLYDCATAGAVLFAVGLVLEWRIRRKQQTTDHEPGTVR